MQKRYDMFDITKDMLLKVFYCRNVIKEVLGSYALLAVVLYHFRALSLKLFKIFVYTGICF